MSRQKYYIDINKQLTPDTIERLECEFGIMFIGEPEERKFARNLSDVGTTKSRKLNLQLARLGCHSYEEKGKLYRELPGGKKQAIGKIQIGVLDDDKKAFATVVKLDWGVIL